MKILAIRGVNLASLPRFDIDLTAPPLASAGLFAITGDTGAGKSTILDALCLALYGTYPRVATRIQNDKIKDPGGEDVPADDPRNILRRGASSGFAEADFAGADGRIYTARWEVRRARDKADGRMQAPTTRLDLKDGSASLASGRTAVLEAVQRATGFTFEQFKRTVLLAQGEFDAFLVAKEGERAELLEKITGLDIYSLISKRVFEETSARSRSIETRRQTLGMIAVLDEPARVSLDEERMAAALKGEALSAEALKLSAVIARIEAIATTRTKAGEAEAAHTRARDAWMQGAPERTHLAMIDACAPLRRLAERQHETQAALSGARRAADAAFTGRDDAEAALADATAKATAALLTANAASAAVRSAAPDWQKALLLDERIARITAALAPAAAEVALRRSKADSLRRAHETAAADLSAARGRLAVLETRLTETARHAMLAANEAALARAFAARADLSGQLVTARRTYAEASAGLDATRTAIANAEAACDRAIAAADALNRDTHALRSQRAALEPAAIDAASRSLHGLTAQVLKTQDQLTQIAALTGQRTQTAARLQGIETAGTRAGAQIRVLEAERERLDHSRAALAPLAALATASLSEASLHLRQILVEGAPCPVCGAQEHPILSADTAAARLARETLVQRQALDGDIARTARELAQATANGAKAHVEATHLNGVLAALSEDIAGSGGRLAEALGTLAREAGALGFKVSLDPGQPEAAATGLAALAQDISRQSSAFDAKLSLASDLARNIERIEGELTRAVEARDAVRSDLESARQRVTGAERLHAEASSRVALLESQLETTGIDLEAALAAAGLTLAMADADLRGTRARVLALGSSHRAAAGERLIEVDRVAELKERAHAAELGVAAAGEALSAAEALHAGHRLAFEPLAAARAALLGGEALDVHKPALTDAEAKAREALDAARLTASAAEAGRSAARAHVTSAQAALAVAEEGARSATEQLAAAAAAIGQTTEAVGLHLALPTAATEALRARLGALDAALNSAATTLAMRQRDFQAALAQGDTPHGDALPGLITEREKLGHARDLITQRVAEISQTLRLDDDARVKAAAHASEIAAAEAAHAVWADVNAAIGESTGARFRRFAQSVTLRELLAIGDRKLADLNPRYGLKQGSVSDLGIEIVDRDMVDEVRSPRSLSGGERFLVSLALALALAELEGKSSFVDTLFIDEGFGSLDRETLESAIDALERLQDQGRKVGVVTHVAAMIERIGVQVRVERQGGGRSRVRVVSGAKHSG